jgi:RNA polymerase sigma factor (TIGR02999 family)
MSNGDDITELLQRWRAGSDQAMEELIGVLYEELRRIARAQMRGERPGHTLEPTALVHAAYERLLGLRTDWQDRTHFLSMASRVMRQVLVDHARARRRGKRGGDFVRITLDGDQLQVESPDRLLDLDRALDALGELDERKRSLLEMHYFGGMTYAELAAAHRISDATVHRELRLAKAWMARELGS